MRFKRQTRFTPACRWGKLNPIYVLTHDSIALGQDGPTHQPIEQVATLRMIPNMDVWRPCDTAETTVAWRVGLEHRTTPTSLILSRQNHAFQTRSAAADTCWRGRPDRCASSSSRRRVPWSGNPKPTDPIFQDMRRWTMNT